MVGRYRWAALAGAMLVTLQASPARSQAAPGEPPATDAMTQATDRFFAGQKLYADKKFEEALVEFRASYAAVPSPNSRLYVARGLRRLGRNGAAYDEYGQVILEAADRAAEDKKYAATQQAEQGTAAAEGQEENQWTWQEHGSILLVHGQAVAAPASGWPSGNSVSGPLGCSACRPDAGAGVLPIPMC